MANIIDYNTLPQKQFLEDLRKFQEAYFVGNPLITDEFYEELVKIYETRFNEAVFDYSTQLKPDTTLPFKLPALKKVYTIKKELQDFESTVITSKLDGVSCLLVKNGDSFSLFTKGPDDSAGRNISNILPQLNLPLNAIKHNNLTIRGELIIPKEKRESKTPLRSQVIGLLNKKDADLSCIHMVAYQIIANMLAIPDQLNILKSLNFRVVKHMFSDNKIAKDLTSIYTKFKEEEDYEIDGLVIYEGSKIFSLLEKSKHIFAFKQNTLFAETTVLGIQWTKSKQGRFIPVLDISPIEFREFKINKVNGYNARYLQSNEIGIGSKLLIQHAGDVIPTIKDVLTKSKDMPGPETVFKWDDTGVHYITLDHDINQEIKNYISLFKIRGVGDKIIEKCIDALQRNDQNIVDIFSFLEAIDITFRAGQPMIGPKTDSILFSLIELFKFVSVDLKSLIRAKYGLRKNIYAKISNEDLLLLTEDKSVKFFLDNREKFEETFNILN
ncbi:putative NAD-dependent DNA ligase [Diachasmimorpha longicaudata entomopoxvirus]|uniref:Putative NAD-dependent DNA ligase n=1 Tax=Diachasmimorpha longicaudata entomopoxvirus TaxID=109981 RepID=A0A7R5WJ79_9POXV|nr:putative NAD-dependent DNA ligase [Diachasmimorpha longicaudata entomopoxvirus]AKS26363.1 putative NAD-dependent DNA ligase [Diachasmimorpha longicaudata entomopoxvirus]